LPVVEPSPLPTSEFDDNAGAGRPERMRQLIDSATHWKGLIMGRFLWVLPLCLIFQGQGVLREVSPADFGAADVAVKVERPKPITLSERDQICHDLVGSLGLMPSAGVPAGMPWYAFYQIGKKDLFPLENILIYQPSLFFQMCLDRYDQDIQGYTCLFCKQERVKGKLLKAEKILVDFREKPFSVRFEWKEGKGLASKVLYVDGENEGNMLVRAFLILRKDPEGDQAMASSRFSIKKYGVRHGLQSTVNSVTKAEAAGRLHLKYDGQFKVDKLGGRICYRFTRAPYDPPEEDGIVKYTFYIDKETWLHIGSELRDVNDEVIADYFFRDLQPNPTYGPNQFTEKGL